MCFWDHKGCALWLLAWANLPLLETMFPNILHSLLLKFCQHPYIHVIFQGDSRVFTMQVWLEIVRPNYSALRVVAMWADDGAICTRRYIRTFCCNGDRKLNKIGTWAHLHVNGKITHLPFSLSQYDLAKGHRVKTQPTWLREVVDWSVMKDMSTNMFQNALSKWRIESYNGPTIWTHHANVIKKVSVRISVLHHKTGFPWLKSMHCYLNTSSTKTYHPVLNTESNQRV
jgi:hypothetical protein